jgi:hypothetical protein
MRELIQELELKTNSRKEATINSSFGVGENLFHQPQYLL